MSSRPDTSESLTSSPDSSRYSRLLRLRHVRLNGWQRCLLLEGSVFVAVLLALAEVASLWAILVLPAAVAVTVKAHDVVAGLLERPDSTPGAAPR